MIAIKISVEGKKPCIKAFLRLVPYFGMHSDVIFCFIPKIVIMYTSSRFACKFVTLYLLKVCGLGKVVIRSTSLDIRR